MSSKTNSSAKNTKFEEIQRRNIENVNKKLQSFEDSDEEKDNEVDKKTLSDLFCKYEGTEGDVANIRQFFENGDSIDCLICIRQVKSKDKVWNCTKCYRSFHLLCIQKWANQKMIQKRIFIDNQPPGYYNNSGQFIPKKVVEVCWDCPQCRLSYKAEDVPRHYECYCGKERDPQPQPFLVPHSCGEICDKPLIPSCGHRCRLLCHPGFHPSCAQVISKSCECGKSPIKSIRCSTQTWSCGRKCQKTLPCLVHQCEGSCHEKCPPCNKSSVRKCSCSKQSKSIKCVQESWSCEKACGQPYPCNKHYCDRVCHEGDCGDCRFGLERKCFCGKQIFIAESCEEFSVESCGDTCLKPLQCGNANHLCLSRCHAGSCGSCTELIEKKCRCGNLSREFPCSKELLCETKCKRLKDCKKHACNRKCCIECSPCDKMCGKFLSCGKHKCSALCHDGNCYPCNEQQKIKCRCGATTMTVICGKNKKNKSPKCKELCKIPSKCHHEPLPHKCHQGPCDNCSQICNESLPCSHNCLAKCHDFVKTVIKDKNFVPKLPGEFAEEKIEMTKLSHPPCQTKIPVVCPGGHETALMDCSRAVSTSCGRKCNRPLECGNHRCSLECHAVSDSKDQDENCENCDSPCTFERLCSHPCPKSCHQNACKRCVVQIKSKCFCGLTEVYYRCCDVIKPGLDAEQIDERRRKHLCCGSRCIKNYPCGHQCIENCHPGECNGVDTCSKKVKLTCACKTRKVDLTCDRIRAEKISVVDCDENCETKKLTIAEEKRKKAEEQRKLEEERNKEELLLYEKKLGRKKYKERKVKVVEEKSDNKLKIIAISSTVVLIAVAMYFILWN